MQLRELTKGIITSNPLFVIVLGVCPSLATSGELKTAFAMGLAATFVCVGSNVIISLLRNVIPSQVRIPCYIVVIATFVTIVDLFLKAYFPAISKSIGVFIPLIVVNCIMAGRAEAVFQGACAGIGFTVAILLMSGIRERIVLLDLPKPLRGMPIAFVCTGLMALALLGFAGMV